MELILGAFLAVTVAIAVLYAVIRSKIRGFSHRVFGNPDLLEALESVDSVEDQSPRSVNGCDRLLLPQILADFPDFDPDAAKTYVRDHLRQELGGRQEFTIYNVVIAKYLRSAAQKSIVYQAALSYREDDRLQQKRYDIQYTYQLGGQDETVAANCPNCGGALGYGQTVCPYCGSRVVNVFSNTWRITEMVES